VADCDLTAAGKGKTTTKHMTGDSEVERDLRKMKTAPPGAKGENEQDWSFTSVAPRVIQLALKLYF
jgi:hypothetical protein